MPILNASIFTPGAVEYLDPTTYPTWYAKVQAAALRQIAAGLNTYTTAGSWSTVIKEYDTEEEAIDECGYFATMIQLKTDATVLAAYNAKHGTAITELPITLQTSIGDYWPAGWPGSTPDALQWEGVDGASSLFRLGSAGHYLGGDDTATTEDDPAEAGYIDVYHTCVQDEMTSHGLGLRALMGHNGLATGVEPVQLFCPNYRGTYYDNAMAKFEQYCKWLKPVHVAIDQETWSTAFYRNWKLGIYLYGKGESDPYDLVLDNCSRCLTLAGFEAGKDSFAKAIIDTVHTSVPSAVVSFYDCYSAKASFLTELYGGGLYNNFGDCSASTISTGSPTLYQLSWVADPATQLAVEQAKAAPRYGSAPSNESGQYGTTNLWWGVQPTALLGSYVWLTHCATSTMDLTDNGTYLTNAQFYDLCYALGRAGAVGFYMYPGYSNTVTCANNTALDRLIPQGIAAFAAARTVDATESISGRAFRR